ncbi:hypothetical protein C8Q74DRAFT_239368 [Fomes fomentarius]|nr:hypothetical protein C8Q74DRAFT_239368 [Fomes fomentarius]
MTSSLASSCANSASSTSIISSDQKSQGRTPVATSHSSRSSSLDKAVKSIRENIEPSPHHGKAYALIRDGYCCMVTGRPDMNCYALHSDAFISLYGDRYVALTQCRHIIPFSVNSFNEERDETFGFNLEGTAFFWGILKMFGYHLQPELAGDKINRLENVMTLSVTIHSLFDNLYLWLEEVKGKENTYRTCLPDRMDVMRNGLSVPPEVHFISHNIDLLHGSSQGPAASDQHESSRLALPNPRYLRLHAACCRVAHLSGAAEYLNEIYRELDEIQVLAADGSSAEVLSVALWGVRNVGSPM